MVPVYTWSTSTPVSTDYELPPLRFEAIGLTNATDISISSQSYVGYGCTNVTGTLNGDEVEVTSTPPPGPSLQTTVPEPMTLSAGLIALSTTGLYLRRRTKTPK